MKDMILQFVEQMTHEEKVELQMALERAIAEEMVPEAGGEADACPRCGCPKFVRKGHGRKGEASGADVERVLAGKIAEGSIVSTDRHQSHPKVLEGMGVAAHNRYDAKNRAEGDINMVNALHSRLKEFLGPFHGVATRRLQHYLDWFCYREQFRKSDADRREVAFADAAAGKYQTSRREYALAPHPFVEYWDNGAMSTVV